ncbi:hypothetical protein, partial [Kaarinaea lacus]
MFTHKISLKPASVVLILFGLLLPFNSSSQPLHSVMLSVPEYSEEALNWCGPATAQMVMEAYPSGACSVLQEDIWAQVLLDKTESLWDTDPAGMSGALKTLCPPPGNWSIYHKTDPTELMFRVAYWMTRNSFPVAIVKDTVAHNSYTAHSEHWVAIRGIITDADPTTTTSVNLENVWFNDPAPADLGDPAIVRFVTGTQWYSEFEPVTKVGSTYHGKHVAVIEPPAISGIAIAKAKLLFGTLISADKAKAFAQRWIEEKKLYELEPYKLLSKAKPLPPLLVNEKHGGYYVIPYSSDGKQAQVAVIVNAYNGEFEEVGAFKPISYLSKQQAINIALQTIKVTPPSEEGGINPQPEPPADPDSVALVFPEGQRVVSRYFPIWKVTANRQTIGVSQQKHVFTRMPRLQPSVPAAATQPQGLAWDNKQFWLFDNKTGELKSIDKRSGAPIKTYKPKIKQLSASTFGGESLWLADQGEMKILEVNPETGEVTKSIPLNYPKDKGFDTVTGMAWDGENLWIAIAAGFSSSINQIDTNTGEIKRSLFAECDPKNIDVRDNALYTICYNNKHLPTKINRRDIVDKNHEMLRG